MKRKIWRSRPEKVRKLVRALVDKAPDEKKGELLEVVNGGISVFTKMQTLNKKMKIPKLLACPLDTHTSQLMENPVVLSPSGVTYDHHNILGSIEAEDPNFPKDATLIPNKLVSTHIANWCAIKGYQLPTIDPAILDPLLAKLSSNDMIQTKEAASEIHTICRRRPASLPFLSRSQRTVAQLIAPLLTMQSVIGACDLDVEADLISALFYISLQDDYQNLKTVVQTPGFLSVLYNCLRSSNLTSRESALSTVCALGRVEFNAIMMYQMPVFMALLKPFLPASEVGESSALGDSEREDADSLKRAAASAIYTMFSVPENREEAVEDGVVKIIYSSIAANTGLIDMLAPALVSLSSTEKSADELGKLGALKLMAEFCHATDQPSIKESCLRFIWNSIKSFKEPDKVMELLETEDSLKVMSGLATTDTSSKRVIKLANSILAFLNNAEYPTPQYEPDELTTANQDTLSKLLTQLSSCSQSMKHQAAKTLRLITSSKVSVMPFFTNKSMEVLIQCLESNKSPALRDKIDANLEEDVIATVYNILKQNPNKTPQQVISVLTYSLKSVRIETITVAISALHLISKHEANAILIFKSMNAIKPLLDLLTDSGHQYQPIKKDVTETICNLFRVPVNLKEALSKDLHVTICGKLEDTPVANQEGLLSVICVFSETAEAVQKLAELNLFSVLFPSVKDITDSPIVKEKCVLIVYNMLLCSNTDTKQRLKEELKRDGDFVSAITNLAKNPVTAEQASEILKLMERP